jgi:hypothetical protein
MIIEPTGGDGPPSLSSSVIAAPRVFVASSKWMHCCTIGLVRFLLMPS